MKLNVTIIWSSLRGEKGINKISKLMSMVGQLNGFFLSHSFWPWCPANFQFPEKKKKSVIARITRKP